MAIQHRRGVFSRFDSTKLLPGEWAVVLSGDTSARDGKAAYICFAAGDVKRIATFEDMAENIANVTDEIVQQLTEDVGEAVSEANAAAAAARNVAAHETQRVAAETQRAAAENARASAENSRASVEQSRASAESARAAAESARAAAEQSRADAEDARVVADLERDDGEAARVLAEQARSVAEQQRAVAENGRASAEEGRQGNETGREEAESARVVAEARRVAEFAEMEQRSKGWLRYYCTEEEVDPVTRKPVVSDPDTATLYYVAEDYPTEESQWVEWMWDAPRSRWEALGTTEATVYPVTSDIIDSIASGDTETGSEVLQTTGLSYLWAKLRAAFASIAHVHDAADVSTGTFEPARIPNLAASKITSGTLGIARGGTGKASHTANSVLLGNGTSAVKNKASANGALFATGANAEPSFGTLPVAQGGTGGTTAADARTALGAASQDDMAAVQDSISNAFEQGALDCDELPTGIHYVNSYGTNTPVSGTGGMCVCVKVSTGTQIVQAFVTNNANTPLHVRRYSSGEWTTWRQVG